MSFNDEQKVKLVELFNRDFASIREQGKWDDVLREKLKQIKTEKKGKQRSLFKNQDRAQVIELFAWLVRAKKTNITIQDLNLAIRDSQKSRAQEEPTPVAPPVPIDVETMLDRLGAYVDTYYSQGKINKSKQIDNQFTIYEKYFEHEEVSEFTLKLPLLPVRGSELDRYRKQLIDQKVRLEAQKANIDKQLQALKRFKKLSEILLTTEPERFKKISDGIEGFSELSTGKGNPEGLKAKLEEGLKARSQRIAEIEGILSQPLASSPLEQSLSIVTNLQKSIKKDLLGTFCQFYEDHNEAHLRSHYSDKGNLPPEDTTDFTVLMALLNEQKPVFTIGYVISKFCSSFDDDNFSPTSQERFYKQIFDVVDCYEYALSFRIPSLADPEKLKASLFNISVRLQRAIVKIEKMKDSADVMVKEEFYRQALKGLSALLKQVNKVLYFDLVSNSSLTRDFSALVNSSKPTVGEAIAETKAALKVTLPAGRPNEAPNSYNEAVTATQRFSFIEKIFSKPAVHNWCTEVKVRDRIHTILSAPEVSNSDPVVPEAQKPKNKYPTPTVLKKLRACRTLIEKHKPSILKWWRSEEYDRYTQLEQDITKICMVQAFMEGEINEASLLKALKVQEDKSSNEDKQKIQNLISKLLTEFANNIYHEKNKINDVYEISDSVDNSFKRIHRDLIGAEKDSISAEKDGRKAEVQAEVKKNVEEVTPFGRFMNRFLGLGYYQTPVAIDDKQKITFFASLTNADGNTADKVKADDASSIVTVLRQVLNI